MLNDHVLTVVLALAAAGSVGAEWRYEVTWAQGQLVVEAELPAGSASLGLRAPAFVRDLRVDGAPAEDLASVACVEGCRVEYRFDLDASVGEVRDAERAGRVVATRPGHWLAAPARAPPGARFRLRVHTPKGTRFVCGLERAGDAYVGPAQHLADTPHAAFGPLDVVPIAVPGAQVTLALEAGRLAVPRAVVEAWVQREASRVGRYLGRFPVRDALVLALPVGRDDIPFGTAHGFGGAAVKIYVGRGATAQTFADDWKLRHELVHLALPNLHPRHRWLEEGLATYLEAVLGATDEAALWSELAEGVAQGLPRGDGFDGTRRWGETYWGGALYWLMADVQIRAETEGRRGLQDALRALVVAGGDITARWSLEDTLARADAGTHARVLTRLYAAFGVRGDPVDLDALLARLGVQRGPGGVRLVADAPWAGYRRQVLEVSGEQGEATRSPARSP